MWCRIHMNKYIPYLSNTCIHIYIYYIYVYQLYTILKSSWKKRKGSPNDLPFAHNIEVTSSPCRLVLWELLWNANHSAEISSYIHKIIIQHTTHITYLTTFLYMSYLMSHVYIYICMPYMICIHMKPCIQTYEPPGGLQEISQLSEALYLTSSCTACCTWRRVMGRCIQSHPKCDKQMMIMLDVWWLRIDNW